MTNETTQEPIYQVAADTPSPSWTDISKESFDEYTSRRLWLTRTLYTSPPAPVAWSYCPECGCEELHHEEGEHKQCASCHQEWFSDIDYSDVVRGNLAKLKAEQPAPVSVAIGTLHRDCDERIVFESSGEIHIKDGMPVFAEQLAPVATEVVAHRIIYSDGEASSWMSGKPSELDVEDVADDVLRSIELAYAAPVAVVLPSHQEMHILISKAARQADLTPGANYFTAAEFAAIALLDKVKELNQ